MQDNRSHHLDIEMKHERDLLPRMLVGDGTPLSEHPVGGLTEHRVGFGQQIVERFSCREPLPEPGGFSGQFLIGEPGGIFP